MSGISSRTDELGAASEDKTPVPDAITEEVSADVEPNVGDGVETEFLDRLIRISVRRHRRPANPSWLVSAERSSASSRM